MNNAPCEAKDARIPGYRLLEPLGCGGFGEVWKCEAPGGLWKAIKIVRGSPEGSVHHTSSCADKELKALQLVKSIRHPFLLSIERVEVIDGDLVIVMELADRSLHDLLEECRQDGQAGLSRATVLRYLHEAADALDVMNQEHGLQHLDIKPRNLFLVGRHVKVADFGLVNSLAELYADSATNTLSAITPLYAAPEIFSGQVTLFSDQYSLAATYHELITGEVPLKGKNVRHLAVLATTVDPDLGRLPEHDRAVVARALAKDPRQRYPSCTAFVEALEAAGPPLGSSGLSGTTKWDLAQTRTTGSTVTPAPGPPNASGVYRRQSKVVPVCRQATTTPTPDAVLPGYQLQECLGRGSAGELWRAQGPLGGACTVRFFTPPDPARSPAGEDPLVRLLGLRHEHLAPLQAVPIAGGRVALIGEAGDSSLVGRFKECQAAGQAGIPRLELLDYLAQVADALDHLYHLYQIQHLALAPRHVALSAERVLLLDFGLAELLWVPEGLQPATLNPRYAAVEQFNGLISDACDQYSLALIYQEMLVGVHPLRNLNARQMASAKLRGQPDLSLLPGADRPIVLQALHPDPQQRFRSCREFILALEEVTHQVLQGTRPSAVGTTLAAGAMPEAPATDEKASEWRPAVEAIVAAAAEGHEVRTSGTHHYRCTQGQEVEQRCTARLAPGMAKLKVGAFRDHWRGRTINRREGRHLLEVPAASSLLERCLGRMPGLLVEVCFGTPKDELTPIRITLRPSSCSRGRAEALLAEMGPPLLESLRIQLNSESTAAAQERYPIAQTAHVEVPGGQGMTLPVRDLGLDGICVRSPMALPQGAATVTLTHEASSRTVQVPGWVRECVPTEDGRFEVEISF
jgi:serine/threonine protein kinase